MSENQAARPYDPTGNPGGYPPANPGWNPAQNQPYQPPYQPYAPGNSAGGHQPAYDNQPPAGPPPYQQPYSPAPYNETSGEQRQILATKGQRGIVFGVLWLVGGLLLSLITYSMAARGGGVYFVAYGPVIYGIYRIVSGIMMVNKSKR